MKLFPFSFRFSFRSIFAIAVFLLIGYNLFLSAIPVLNNDIDFNTDLARDFLLLEEVQTTHKLPLIGPRSGGISGVFHGPLWIWINIPAFLLGQGNPVIVGWFWVLLVFLLIIITYWVGTKFFGKTVGLLSALLLSTLVIRAPYSLFNPFGAVLISPIFFYGMYIYITQHKVRYVLLALFSAGLLIQFQVAFGLPMLFLSTILILYTIIKKRKFPHLLAFLILLIPLSTYIIFDLRHDFLEGKALIAYVQGSTGQIKGFTWQSMLLNRYNGFWDTLTVVANPTKLVTLLIPGFFLLLFLHAWRHKATTQSKIIFLFFYFYLGFWLITLLFRGVVWGYYTWPFLPLTVLLIAAAWKILPKFIFCAIYLYILVFVYKDAYAYTHYITTSYIGKTSGSWQFNYQLAQTVFSQGDKRFGYYIFSPDQYGYSPRYAMNYVATKNPRVQVVPYQKQPITYLLIAAPGGDNNAIGGDWWKTNRVRITSMPEKTFPYPNGYRIEKHRLSDKEVAIPSDPNLIDSLIFR